MRPPLDVSIRRVTPLRPWIFALLSIPAGAFTGFCSVVLPYSLRKSGVSVGDIGNAQALADLPLIVYFLWAPLVDSGLPARLWLVISAVVSAAFLFVSLQQTIPSHLASFITIVVIGRAINLMTVSAVGSIVADEKIPTARSQEAGWIQVGNLGGAAVAGAVLVALSKVADPVWLGLIAAALVFVPTLPALFTRKQAIVGRDVLAQFAEIIRELGASLRSRKVRLGLCLFLSPIGASAILSLFSALAVDYGADQAVVASVVASAAVMMPVGALVGGYLCKHIDRITANVLGAALSGIVAVSILVSPRTITSYVVGWLFYAFVTGMCFAAGSALALELIGDVQQSSATRYTIFVAISNLPIAYMTKLDASAYDRFGLNGLFAFDAIASLGAAAVFYLLLRRVQRPDPRSGPPYSN